MSRYKGPKIKINRRFGKIIFPNISKAFERKPYPPGIHGPRSRRRISDFSLSLNEKQKLRYMYGLQEKQFKNLFQKAKKSSEITGEIFLKFLELRLDNIVFRLKFSSTRRGARQLVNHGHIKVNGKKVDIPSYRCSVNDLIETSNKKYINVLIKQNLDNDQERIVPNWLNLNEKDIKGTVIRMINNDEAEQDINIQLVVEYYSR